MKVRKMIQTAMLIAIGYICNSLIIVPLGFVRIAPMQHVMNIITSALLGPWYSLAQAFGVSFLRNITGTGSLLAFPGSMIGHSFRVYYLDTTRNFGNLVWERLLGRGCLGHC